MRLHRFGAAGTLAVVCLAAAMLMLDIAVVNTAPLVGAAGALASAALLTGRRNKAPSGEPLPYPA